MTRVILIILFFVLSNICVAQTNRIGVSFSPNYAYRVLQRDGSTVNNAVAQIPKWGYRATASFERNFHKKASFFTGISFVNNGYQTEEFTVLYSSTPPPNAARSIRIRTSFYQLELPIGVNYFIPIKKVKLFFSAGISTNYLVKVVDTRIAYTINNDEEKSNSTVDKDVFNPFSFSAIGAFGIEFNLSQSYTMRIAPNLHYTFTDVMSDKSANTLYLTSSGVSFGVYRAL